jgi:hypothetical protein
MLQRASVRLATIFGAAVTATVAFSPAATASPDNRHTIPVQVDCADGTSYALSTLDADSPWAAFHGVVGTGTFIPAYYGDVLVQVFTADGSTLLFEDDSPGYAPRGAVPDGLGEIKDCSFIISNLENDPALGEVMIRVQIELGLWVAPQGGHHG